MLYTEPVAGTVTTNSTPSGSGFAALSGIPSTAGVIEPAIMNSIGPNLALPVILPSESVENSIIEGGVHGAARSGGRKTLGGLGGGADRSATAPNAQKL